MNAMILAGLPDEFDELAVRAMTGEEVEAELAALVARAREAAGIDAGWQQRLEGVREHLMARMTALSIPKAGLPITLENPHIEAERAFYADAIAHLNALLKTA